MTIIKSSSNKNLSILPGTLYIHRQNWTSKVGWRSKGIFKWFVVSENKSPSTTFNTRAMLSCYRNSCFKGLAQVANVSMAQKPSMPRRLQPQGLNYYSHLLTWYSIHKRRNVRNVISVQFHAVTVAHFLRHAFFRFPPPRPLVTKPKVGQLYTTFWTTLITSTQQWYRVNQYLTTFTGPAFYGMCLLQDWATRPLPLGATVPVAVELNPSELPELQLKE